MSRMRYSDDGEGMSYEMWAHNARLAVTGRRGQKALRELEAALLAMPAQRLIATHICQGGDVCALGALALHRKRAVGFDEAAALAAVRADYVHAASAAGYRLDDLTTWDDGEPDQMGPRRRSDGA